ncbi:MAG TPA: sialate O-acetylesterase, partial [Phycisphaerales bacterium]|nr:sialate O-acetylesterase [Phycisphaerales bacterium]
MKIYFSVPVVLILSLIVVLVCAAGSFADVRLPAVISDNMVLQQGGTVPIWGWAEPGEKVKVSGSWQNREWQTTADKNGKWMVKIQTPKAGGPYELTIKGKNEITLDNVLVGEVWVCSGQSNMQFILRSTRDKKEIKAADYPEIRLFTVKQAIADEPQDDCEGRWLVCNPQTAAHFSAVAYFFGQQLHKELNVPVGLIHTSWGGSPAEAWTKKSVLESDPQLKPFLTLYADMLAKYPEAKKEYERKINKWKKAAARARSQGGKVPPKPRRLNGPRKQRKPSGLYNAMLAPLMPYRIAGVIWYQGESNT